MTAANGNASVQGLGDCAETLASGPHYTDVKAAIVLLWVLGCQEGKPF